MKEEKRNNYECRAGREIDASEFQFHFNLFLEQFVRIHRNTTMFLDSEAEPAYFPVLSTLLKSHHLQFLRKKLLNRRCQK